MTKACKGYKLDLCSATNDAFSAHACIMRIHKLDLHHPEDLRHEALQSATTRPDPRVRSGRAHAQLHQGGRGVEPHPVGRQPPDPRAGGQSRRRHVRAPHPRADPHQRRPPPAAHGGDGARRDAGDDQPHPRRRQHTPPHRDDDGRLRLAVADPAAVPLHGHASGCRRAHPSHLRQRAARARGGRRRRALCPPRCRAVRGRASFRRGGDACLRACTSCAATAPAHAEGSRAAHAAASRHGARHPRLGHVADGRRPGRPQARGVPALRQLRAADPGRAHGARRGARHQAAGGASHRRAN